MRWVNCDRALLQVSDGDLVRSGPPTILAEASRAARRATVGARPTGCGQRDREGAPGGHRRRHGDLRHRRRAGRLWYVGYEIADLAAHATFEEVVYLLHNRTLPTRTQLDELDEFLVDERELEPVPRRS